MNKVKIDGLYTYPFVNENDKFTKLDFICEMENEVTNKKNKVKCCAWNTIAKIIQENFVENDPIYIEGSIQRETWKSGVEWKDKTYVLVEKAKKVSTTKPKNSGETEDVDSYSNVNFSDTIPF